MTLGKDRCEVKMNKDKLLLVNLKMFDEEEPAEPEVVVYGKDEEEQQVSQEEPQLLSTFDFDFKQLSDEGKKVALASFKENFKDDLQQEFQSNFDRRFKDNKEVAAKVSQYEPIVSDLMKFYKVADIAELQAKIDEDILKDLAEEQGFNDVSKYKEYRDAIESGKRGKEIESNITQEQQRKATVDGWIAESDAIKKIYPSFELNTALDNEKFQEKLRNGYSFADAFQVTLEKSFQTKTNKPDKVVRPNEQGAKSQGGVVRKTDPSKFTDADMDDIRARVARGETIKL